MTLTREYFRRQSNRFSEVAGDFCQGSEKQIAKTVAAKLAIAAKAILEKSRQQSRVFRERDHAVADVAGRKHLQLIAQTPGTATIIRNGDDRGETIDPDRIFSPADQTFETGEQS